jgi:hypothetical protein
MTDTQRSYLDTLARQAGEGLPADLTEAEASEHIDRLPKATGQTKGVAATDIPPVAGNHTMTEGSRQASAVRSDAEPTV